MHQNYPGVTSVPIARVLLFQVANQVVQALLTQKVGRGSVRRDVVAKSQLVGALTAYLCPFSPAGSERRVSEAANSGF